MERLASGVRGALTGATAGAIAGLCDQLVRGIDPGLAASPTASFAVVLLSATAWAPVGLLLGLALPGRVRWTEAIVAGASLLAVVGGYVNLRWLPSLLDPASLLADAGLVAGFGLLVVASVRSSSRFDIQPRIAALVLAGVLVATGLASWRAARPGGPGPQGSTGSGPDVLVVLLDALRADHCSSYGYARETTPVLDRIAGEGIRFTSAYSVSSWTKPVVATLFSGMYPTRHRNHAINAVLPAEVTTLPEVYASAGYRTAVFAENNFVSPLFGFEQGVEHFEGSDPPVYAQTILGHVAEQIAVRVRALEPVVAAARGFDAFDPGQADFAADGIDLPDRVVRWIGGLGDADRFFAYVHLLKPHAPYEVPPRFEGLFSGPGSEGIVRPPHMEGLGPFAAGDAPGPEWVAHLVDNYDERIRFGDFQLGQIVDGIRATGRDPLVVVLSDHGEEFGENGLFDHGHSLQEGVVRVPLVVSWRERWPAGGGAVDVDCRLLDLPPSLLSWSGLPIPGSFDGEPALGAVDPVGRPVLLEVEHGPGYRARGLVRDHLKLVSTEQGSRQARQVFDLLSDPLEETSLARPGADPLVWMEAELQSLVAALEGRGTLSGETSIDPATEERLRALGYIR